LDRGALERDGIFNPSSIERLVGEHLADRANHSHLLFSLLSFQLWKERYLS
jgi:asparagine synthase (glutamine-hydrolysing)